MERRKFITALSASAAFVALEACRKTIVEPIPDGSFLKGPNGNNGNGNNGQTTRYPLNIPPVVAATAVGTLTAAMGSADLGGNTIANNVLKYNGEFPGPTLEAHYGDQVNINFHNGLSEESITHWHGMIVDHQNDGHPMQVVSPGGTYPYSYPIIQRACMNWYHPHPHMRTGHQVYHGLAGAFIIRDNEEAGLNLPSGEFEVPLVIRDASFENKSNDLHYRPKAGGFLGNFPLVNGTIDPYLNVKRAVYRFRIINGSNSRIYGLHLGNSWNIQLIGNDGGLLPFSTSESIIHIANGERLDVLIDFSSFAAGTKIMLRDSRSGWDLLEFRVTGNSVISSGYPAISSSIPILANPVRTRVFDFQGMSKINGQEYDMNRIDFQVPYGDTELWRFNTAGNAPHPVHVHGTYFQVKSRAGGRGQVFPWEQGWKDTVLLEDNESVEVLIRFDHGYTGEYLMHCHKLEHEDMGMMSNFEVI